MSRRVFFYGAWGRTMFCGGRSVLVVACAGAVWAAPDELLSRIRDRMEDNLERAPNYTCLETIERAQRRNAKQEFRTVDRLRFEVALVGGKELYSWPGEGRFGERGPGEMAPGGTTTTGDYALHADTVFASPAPEFSAGSEETLEGRRVLRYPFRIGPAVTGYRVQVGNKRANVPYRGSFWADAESLDLIRLEVEVDEIPAEMGIARATTRIDYGKVRVGVSDFLLPQRVDFLLERLDGSQSRNRTVFSGCRQYVGESAITFEELTATPPAPAAREQPPPAIALPGGLTIETRLEAPLDSAKAVVGDTVTARVTWPVKKDGRVMVPKGALLRGRVRKLELIPSRWPYYDVEVEFTELAWEQGRARWTARLESAGPLVGAPRGALAAPPQQAAGVAQFYVRGGQARLPPGFKLLWITEAAKTARSSR